VRKLYNVGLLYRNGCRTVTAGGASGTRVFGGCRSGADWAFRRLRSALFIFTPNPPPLIPGARADQSAAQVCVVEQSTQCIIPIAAVFTPRESLGV
jgi:hypothetical protein